MRLTFHGAAGEVTGSCYLIQTATARVLLDCGLFQGGPTAELKNRREFAFDPKSLDAIVLSHAHLDHSGRLPIVARKGYAKRVYCTRATLPLSDILLRDAAHLQGADMERLVRRRGLRGCKPGQACWPLFVDEDVTALMRLLTAMGYDERREIAPGVSIRFVDAGHIIGSASVEVTVKEGGKEKVLAFSADIGERGTALLPDPTHFLKADGVVLETTYGDRDHKPLSETLEEFAAVINDGYRAGGKILIPAFAVGRTQTLLYHLGGMHREGKLPSMPVFVDSPMAVRATELYESSKDGWDEESRNLMRMGIAPLKFSGLRMSRTSDESKAINNVPGPAIIIAGAGMCNGGRILHHLIRHAGNPTTRIVIAGFQAQNTLGRRLVEGASQIRIMGQPIDVRARVHTLGGFSAHGGRTTLLDWFSTLAPGKPRVFLSHGEEGPRQSMAQEIKRRHGIVADRPLLGDSFEL